MDLIAIFQPPCFHLMLQAVQGLLDARREAIADGCALCPSTTG
jgi:hypothetical protein